MINKIVSTVKFIMENNMKRYSLRNVVENKHMSVKWASDLAPHPVVIGISAINSDVTQQNVITKPTVHGVTRLG